MIRRIREDHAFIIAQPILLQILVLFTKPAQIVLRLTHLCDCDLEQFAHLCISGIGAGIPGDNLRSGIFRMSEIVLLDLELRQLAMLVGDDIRQDLFFG